MVQIVLMGVCSVATIFMLTFLKALLSDSRKSAKRPAKSSGRLIVMPVPRRERSTTSRSA